MSQTPAEQLGAALHRITRATRSAEGAAYGIADRANYAGIRLVALQERVHQREPLTFSQRVRLFENGRVE